MDGVSRLPADDAGENLSRIGGNHIRPEFAGEAGGGKDDRFKKIGSGAAGPDFGEIRHAPHHVFKTFFIGLRIRHEDDL